MSKYEPNRWEIYDPDIPKEEQPHSFITKRKLDKMEEGIESANIQLEVGTVTMGNTYDVNITEDKENNTKKLNITFPPAGKGDTGKSAYEVWLDNGNIGTEREFLDYLKGIDGKDGIDGRDGKDGEQGPQGESAYQTWLSMGNTGSQDDFLQSLRGTCKSTYDIWLELGNSGTPEEFLNDLKGEDGHTPIKGVDYYTQLDKDELVQLVINKLIGDGLI